MLFKKGGVTIMFKKLMFVAVVVIAVGLVVSGMALAGESSVTVGTPGTAIPHGGYRSVSPASDACLQCHDIHEASADYVLLRYQTVADTCGSCHYLYLQNPGTMPVNASNPTLSGYNSKSGGMGTFSTSGISPTYDPGYGSTTTPYNPAASSGSYLTTNTAEEASLFATSIPTVASLGSEWSAYEVALGSAGTAPGHQLQRGAGTWNFNDGTTNTADYIPGGSNLLKAIKLDGDNDASTMNSTTDTLAFTATNGLFCVSCHTPHGEFGKLMRPTASDTDSVRISRKLLSAKPNHSFTDPVVSVTTWTVEGGRNWCGRCHDKRTNLNPSVVHTHPDVVCLNGCHGAPGGAAPYKNVSNMDFPHTSTNENLLEQTPDALCLKCHLSGYLP